MPRILVAPLNWGLGHVTRCIPLIEALERRGVSVMLASDGVALHLLKAEFPHLPVVELPSWRIRYGTSNMVWNIALQLPRILYAIRAEHRMVRHLIRTHHIDGIISDNRYGCFNHQVKSVILTHQLRLRIGNRYIQWAANALLRVALRKFDIVWVPDVPGEPNLSGSLSHPTPEELLVRYIGPLSRMSTVGRTRPLHSGLEASTADHPLPVSTPGRKTKYDVAVILSGPEPQRSILEQKLLEQAMALTDRHFTFVQGKTQGMEHHFVAENVEVVSYLTSRHLNELLLSCQVVVCRSGYSSLMDLAALGNKAILIPTPGQTEQEYLADYFADQGVFVAQRQEEIDLEKGLEAIFSTTGFVQGQLEVIHFKAILEEWLSGQ